MLLKSRTEGGRTLELREGVGGSGKPIWLVCVSWVREADGGPGYFEHRFTNQTEAENWFTYC